MVVPENAFGNSNFRECARNGQYAHYREKDCDDKRDDAPLFFSHGSEKNQLVFVPFTFSHFLSPFGMTRQSRLIDLFQGGIRRGNGMVCLRRIPSR